MANNTMTKEERRKYYRIYYRKPENKEKQRVKMLHLYWSKKYAIQFNCRIEECKSLTIEQMKQDIKEGLSRI